MKIRGGRVPTGLLRRQLDVVEERIRSATSLEALMTMEWPGNVRELRMVLTSAAVRAPGREIDLRHLPAEYRGAGTRRHLGSLGSEPPPGVTCGGSVLMARALRVAALVRQ